MKKIALIIILFSVAACGGGSDDSLNNSTPTISDQPQDISQGNVNDTLHPSTHPSTPERSARPRNRFDEEGHLIGVYGVPYIPESAK